MSGLMEDSTPPLVLSIALEVNVLKSYKSTLHSSDLHACGYEAD